jgi:hypothetical protein
MRTGNHHSLSGATAACASLSDDATGCLDGTIIEPDIRCLGPKDENEFCRILLGIEPSDRWSRFGQFVSDADLFATQLADAKTGRQSQRKIQHCPR